MSKHAPLPRVLYADGQQPRWRDAEDDASDDWTGPLPADVIAILGLDPLAPDDDPPVRKSQAGLGVPVLRKALSDDLKAKVASGDAHWVTVTEGPLEGRHLLIGGPRPKDGQPSRGTILAGHGIPPHVITKLTGATHAHEVEHVVSDGPPSASSPTLGAPGTFYVNRRVMTDAPRPNKWVPVEGRPVDLGDGIHGFAYREPNAGWSVAELRTGIDLASGLTTAAAAVSDARAYIQRKGAALVERIATQQEEAAGRSPTLGATIRSAAAGRLDAKTATIEDVERAAVQRTDVAVSLRHSAMRWDPRGTGERFRPAGGAHDAVALRSLRAMPVPDRWEWRGAAQRPGDKGVWAHWRQSTAIGPVDIYMRGTITAHPERRVPETIVTYGQLSIRTLDGPVSKVGAQVDVAVNGLVALSRRPDRGAVRHTPVDKSARARSPRGAFIHARGAAHRVGWDPNPRKRLKGRVLARPGAQPPSQGHALAGPTAESSAQVAGALAASRRLKPRRANVPGDTARGPRPVGTPSVIVYKSRPIIVAAVAAYRAALADHAPATAWQRTAQQYPWIQQTDGVRGRQFWAAVRRANLPVPRAFWATDTAISRPARQRGPVFRGGGLAAGGSHLFTDTGGGGAGR